MFEEGYLDHIGCGGTQTFLSTWVSSPHPTSRLVFVLFCLFCVVP